METTTRRRVIFTADDFGLSEAVNGAVALALRRGVLRCASLMVGAPRAAEALALARQQPQLCLGVHLTLIQGRAVLPPGQIPGLADARGYFRHQPVKTGLRYFFQPVLRPQIRRELAAQMEAVLAAGLTCWHVNGHLNLHLHPAVLPLVLDLAREYGIPAVRLAREDWRATRFLAPDRPIYQAAHGLIFAWLSRRARRRVKATGLLCNDYLFGLTNDGRMTEAYLLGLIPRLKAGVTEIYSHPALYAEAELRPWTPAYRGQEELAALLSPRLKAALAEAGVEVSDFQEMVLGGGG